MTRFFPVVACSMCLLLSFGCQLASQPKCLPEQNARQDTGASNAPSRVTGAFPVDLTQALEPGLCAMFKKLEPGAKEIDGIRFSVSDARIAVRHGEKRHIDLPGMSCVGLHFLHYMEFSGELIGSYTLVYADGERLEIPLRGGVTIQDWWKPGPLLFAAQAHSDILLGGDSPQPVAFWRFSVRNPRPDVPITALEIINSDASATINTIALTLTDTCPDQIGGTSVWVGGMDKELFAIAVLSQPGAAPGKEEACDQLKHVGSVKSIPVLAAYLGDEKLSPAARLALAAMPYPEAKAALHEALGPATGAIKAGIIESLGTTRDTQYVPLLTPFLHDKDPVIAMSATLSLGRIGGPKAVEALKTAARDNSGRLKMVALDALLCCAEALCDTDNAAAYALYDAIFTEWGKEYAGIAAYRGMVRTGGAKASGLLSAALLGDDPRLWDAALPSVREIAGAEVTRTCAGLLGRVPKAILPGLIEALAQRGDKGVAAALAPFVSDPDPEVSGAAIKALALVGDGSTVDALVKVAAHDNESNRGGAMQTLTQINDHGVSTNLLACLRDADAAETAVIAKVMGQRRDEVVGPALRRLLRSNDAAVRKAAIQALGEVGVAKDAERLCQALERAESDPERLAVSHALGVLGKRLDTPPVLVAAVLASLNKGDVPVRCALLDVCGRLPNPDFLQALVTATGDADATIKDTAIRALADSENPQALPRLVALLDTTSDLTHRVLVFRGIARLASTPANFEETAREDALIRALAAADRPEEQKLFLGALGSCHSTGALKAVEGHLASSAVMAEAVLAWGQIAKAIVADHPEEIGNAVSDVLAKAEAPGFSRDAMRAILDVKKALAAVPIPGDQVRFEHTVVDRQFRSEGVAVADVNRDGKNDILVGDLWYAAPEWQAHEIRPPQTYDPNTGYSQCFANFTEDVDKDGWPDSIVIGFPGAPAHWYRNPGEKPGHWQEYLLATAACGETPLYGDLLGDGKPVPVFAINSRITWFRPGQDRKAPWLPFPLSYQQLSEFAQFGHGLGMGDVNGDGRTDVLATVGWWEGPVDRTRPDWVFHAAPLGPACADMIVYDVDGDGDNDVITSSAHEYGVWWFEQRQENGKTAFVQHEIHKGISQTHALILADVNNDGLQDLITGKRYYAHCGHDPGCNEPAMLCWFELQRPAPGKVEYRMHEIDANSGVGTQFKVCDFDEDGLLDVVLDSRAKCK